MAGTGTSAAGRRTRQRIGWALALGVVLLVISLWTLKNRAPRAIPAMPQVIATARSPSVDFEAPEDSSEPAPTAPLAAPGPCRLQVREVRGEVPIAGVTMTVTPQGAASRALEFVSAADGSLTLPVGSGWVLSVTESGIRLLRPKATYAPVADGAVQVVWCYRTATITGVVDVEDPSRVARATLNSTRGRRDITVSARPVTVGPVWGGKNRRSEAAGTPPWIERQMGLKQFLWSCVVKDRQYTLEVPLMGDLAVMAWAPGHTAETLRVDAATAPGAVVQANFLLRKAARVAIRVLDESGIPLQGALVHFINYKHMPTGEVDWDVLRLQKQVGNFGLGIVENAEKGTSRAALKGSTRSGKDGRAEVFQGNDGRDLLLLVCADGKAPYLRKLKAVDEFEDKEIVLERNRPARTGYRVRAGGRFYGEGSTLVLMEMVDSLTLQAASIVAGKDGLFPAESIVPYKDYSVMLSEPGPGRRSSGTARFGAEEVVEISEER